MEREESLRFPESRMAGGVAGQKSQIVSTLDLIANTWETLRLLKRSCIGFTEQAKQAFLVKIFGMVWSMGKKELLSSNLLCLGQVVILCQIGMELAPKMFLIHFLMLYAEPICCWE
jgi:hypothetical protein